VTPQIAKQLKKSGCAFFQISIEGSRAVHDKIRGEGNFDKCMEALAILKKHQIQTMVSFTSSKINADSFAEVVSICKKKDVNVLWTDRYLPLGRGKGMQDELLQPVEVEAFFEQLYQSHQKLKESWFYKTEIRIHRALNFLVAEKHGCNCYQPYKCSAGRTLITILPNGDMLPCRRMPVIVGNVLETAMEDIYENSVLFRMLRKNNVPYPGCEKCSHWEVCNGGLRCLSYAYYGSPFMSDPQCFKIHTLLPNIN
jgi:radical SAM protein with 4Fe4S-binding SPASM domain